MKQSLGLLFRVVEVYAHVRERPDRVCPNPQAVLSSSGTQAMCFRGKPHKRDLAGGRMFQKKPGRCKPRHQLETQLDVVNKANYGSGGKTSG